MSNEMQTNNESFFKSKHFKTTLIISIVVLLAFMCLGMFADSVERRSAILTDGLFSISILFLIFAVFARSRAWSLFKRSVKKNDNNMLEKAMRAKYYSKSLAFIGSINLIASIIALFIYY